MNDLYRRFVTEAVSTASPMTLLLMLMDRLVLDLDRADMALEGDNRGAASEHIVHAEQIVDTLRSSLDPQAWDGAERLGEVYDYVFSLLVQASIRGDRKVLGEARELIAPLRETWSEAAATVEGRNAFVTTAPRAYAAGSIAVGATSGLLGVA